MVNDSLWIVSYRGTDLAVLPTLQARDFFDHAAFTLNLLHDNGKTLEWADPSDRVEIREVVAMTPQEAEENLKKYMLTRDSQRGIVS